ncbi:hypothetical protein [Allorhizocola rhizosphaerae]|uniref:hypothetical protein n=1 Tax=Allorhizocola rhizosphaerae TaxID=1872709 RepID=UPI000E3BED0D|nr:hypothetical protein [Allorhizocola rhizosphaerae]
MGTLAGLDYPEGNPGGLTSAAGRASRLAAQVASASSSVERATRVPGWEGPRYALFAVAARAMTRDLGPAAGALARVSRALTDLAETVQEAQRRIRDWADEIEAAQAKVESVESELHTARARHSLLGDSLAPFPGPSPLDVAQAAYDKAAAHLAELRARYAPKARALCDRVRQQDQRTAHAVLAAADAAPAGGRAALGDPRVPADVRLFAPMWMFGPGESWLPTDPRRNAVDLRNVDSWEEFQRYLRGEGAGAPIFYRVRDFGDERVIEYWFYRRYNQFRDIDPAFKHADDSEAIAVRLVNGRPVQVGYSQHEHGCSLPFADAPRRGGHIVSHPGDGSGANSPYRGHDDRIPGPWDELHGPAPGERTPRDHIVRGEDHLVNYDGPRSGRPWPLLDPDGNRLPGNGSNSGKFTPGADVWTDECEPLPPRT